MSSDLRLQALVHQFLVDTSLKQTATKFRKESGKDEKALAVSGKAQLLEMFKYYEENKLSVRPSPTLTMNIHHITTHPLDDCISLSIAAYRIVYVYGMLHA